MLNVWLSVPDPPPVGVRDEHTAEDRAERRQHPDDDDEQQEKRNDQVDVEEQRQQHEGQQP